MTAISGPDPTVDRKALDSLAVETLRWQAERSAEQIMAEREGMIAALEEAAHEMRASGAVKEWNAGCDGEILQVCDLISQCSASVSAAVLPSWEVSRGVNGLLLEQLAAVTGHVDAQFVEFFRKGAPFLGVLPCSGIGEPLENVVGCGPAEEL